MLLKGAWIRQWHYININFSDIYHCTVVRKKNAIILKTHVFMDKVIKYLQ